MQNKKRLLFILAACFFFSLSVYANTATKTDSLWNVIRQGYQLNHYANQPSVKRCLQYYRQHPQLVRAIAKQAKPFLYLVVKQIQQHHLPTELALIPIIESAFNSTATSSAGASGIWQLMPGTASQYQVTTDTRWYNGRQSVVQSTHAALAYLRYLHDYFDGNWLLTLAAYNAGEGRVSQAIKYNLKHEFRTDFWHLPLPQQTKQYVPKILALAIIFDHPQRYDIQLPAIPNQPLLASVFLPRQLSLVQAAQYAQLPLSTLQRLNPEYTQLATPPSASGDYYLLLPIHHVADFERNLAADTMLDQYQWHQYTVKPGDSLSLIASITGANIEDIIKYNQLTSNYIYPGEHLVYPLNHPKPKANFYKVKPGDSLTTIARHFGVTSLQIQQWNRLPNANHIEAGQQLLIY